jgi:ATP-binding protein involved in chromosome partitioning
MKSSLRIAVRRRELSAVVRTAPATQTGQTTQPAKGALPAAAAFSASTRLATGQRRIYVIAFAWRNAARIDFLQRDRMVTEPLIIRVRNALAAVVNPRTGRSIVAEGHVTGLSASEDGAVRFAIEAPDRALAEAFVEPARAAAAAVAGVTRVSTVATAHSTAPARPAPQAGHANPFGLSKQERIAKAEETLPGVRHVIAVASGKGGVGKSTIAANLAVAFSRLGLRAGLLDADVYGPSLPTLFGLSGKPPLVDGKIQPAEKFGVRAMSIGLLVEPEKALAWRGPMVMGAVRQLMNDVAWGPLDILVIDTPPGTGDAHLTLAQTKRLTGAVVVSTPQEMALADVRRGVELFRKTSVPVLGVIENMAHLDLPGGGRAFPFGEGGARRAAEDLGAPFLGALPLWTDLREASDDGAPPEQGTPAGEAFLDLARRILAAAEGSMGA